MKRLIIVAALLAIPLAQVPAETIPSPGPRDPQIQMVDYDSDQVVRLTTVPGYVLVVELSPDERVETIAMGSTAEWHVTANRRGNLLFIKQDTGAAETNLSVTSDARRYAFTLTPNFAAQGQIPYSVRFRYPGFDPAPELAVEEKLRSYRFGGPRALRPAEMSDDGKVTSIRWPDNVSLPAVYALTPSGDEMIVNGAMRGRYYVVDAIAQKFSFRLGKAAATATRLAAGKRR
jgi:type IV secretion system protein VirB9